MHELSVAHAIVETVTESLESQDRVLRVELDMGDLSGIVEDSLRFCFELATAGTPLEGCVLEISRIPATFHCHPCGATFEPQQSWRMVCPTCQTASADLRGGRELLVRAVEVDTLVGAS